jgi:hypothetical protein
MRRIGCANRGGAARAASRGERAGAPRAWLALLPEGPPAAEPKLPRPVERTVSRVLFRRPGRSPGGGEDHSSRRRVAAPLEHSTRTLAPGRLGDGRFGRATLDSVPIRACSGRGLPRRRSPGSRAWALTPRFHPCLCPQQRAIGGVVSAALSLGSPRVGVTDLPALRSPDFPPAADGLSTRACRRRSSVRLQHEGRLSPPAWLRKLPIPRRFSRRPGWSLSGTRQEPI